MLRRREPQNRVSPSPLHVPGKGEARFKTRYAGNFAKGMTTCWRAICFAQMASIMERNMWKKLGGKIAALVLPYVVEALIEMLEEVLNSDLDGDGKIGK